MTAKRGDNRVSMIFYLYGPVDEDVRFDLPPVEDPVEWASASVLHHQAEVGLFEAHAQETDDVL